MTPAPLTLAKRTLASLIAASALALGACSSESPSSGRTAQQTETPILTTSTALQRDGLRIDLDAPAAAGSEGAAVRLSIENEWIQIPPFRDIATPDAQPFGLVVEAQDDQGQTVAARRLLPHGDEDARTVLARFDDEDVSGRTFTRIVIRANRPMTIREAHWVRLGR